MTDSPEELESLLQWIPDQAERERITKAFFYIANGDPDNFPVQFALFTRGIALAQITAMNAHSEALRQSFAAIDQGQAQVEEIYGAAAAIKAAALRAEQIRFKNLLFSLALAFLAGVVAGAWMVHR